MAQTLNATLLAAQSAIDRRPIVKIVSAPMVGDLPFPGIAQAPLPVDTGETFGVPNVGFEEFNPVAIPLSNGEAAYISIYGSVNGIDEGSLHTQARLVTTRDGRSTFNEPVLITLLPVSAEYNRLVIDESYDPQIGLVELPNGNLGITWLRAWSTGGFNTSTSFYAAEITTAGVPINPSGQVYYDSAKKETYLEAFSYWSGPATVRMANGTYLSVFVHKSDGTHYTIWRKTSTDFATWTARAECVLPTFDTTKQISNPSLAQLSDGTVMLLFDYTDSIGSSGERLRNLYYSLSSDYGANWSTPVKITAYDTYNTVGLHPVVLEPSGGILNLVYTELQTVLWMGVGTLNWGPIQTGKYVKFDAVNRKLYVVNFADGGAVGNVVKVYVDTWTVDKMWDVSSVPAFPDAGGQWRDRVRNDGYLIGFLHNYGISLLDGEADTITNFQFKDDPASSLFRNVDAWNLTDFGDGPRNYQIDVTAQRLYCFGANEHPYWPKCTVGYIDLTDPGPTYEFHEIFFDSGWSPSGLEHKDFLVVPSEDMVFIATGRESGGSPGALRVYHLGTGGLIKFLYGETDPGFPYYGIYSMCYRDGKIYGNIQYTSSFAQDDRRGIVSVDLIDWTCLYYRPSYATIDDYQLWYGVLLASGEILFQGRSGQGVVLWDPDTSIWKQYLAADIPGLPTDTWMGGVAFDEATETIFANGDTYGVVAFNRDGFLYRSKIVDANYTTEWEFGAAQNLTQSWKSYDAVAALGTDGTMLAFWSAETMLGERTIVWGRDSGIFDLSPYIARGNDISLKRSIDGKPSVLEFTVTHGHLFDPTNRGSIWQVYLKKARKLTFYFGEKVLGIDYWHLQGMFLVRETEVLHRRGEYPTMRVKAEDLRCLWEDMDVVATPMYQGYPEDIVKSVLQNLAGVSLSDIVLPTFRWRYEVWIQWLDTSIKKMIEQIGTRFGYAIIVAVDGKVRAVKVAGDNPIDHVYSDPSMVIDWTPDDSFSDFTNRVIVTGESRDFIEVMYQEELIKQLSGTVGWWGHKTVERIWYSEDGSRRCRYPRLNIVESVRNFNFRLGGGGESLSATDQDERWVEITIEMPNLVGIVVSEVAALLALGIEALMYPGGPQGMPGWIFFAGTLILAALFYTIASIAQYQYELFARPLGHERLSIQSSPPHGDDLVFQAELGKIVEKKIDEPLCISAAQCNEYADYEASIIRYQRDRLKFSKVAHLQDDEGDTLQVIQPYSGIAQKVFVTDLTRKMKIPASPDDDGYFTDEIEGWLVG
jgi:hypothetical protein